MVALYLHALGKNRPEQQKGQEGNDTKEIFDSVENVLNSSTSTCWKGTQLTQYKKIITIFQQSFLSSFAIIIILLSLITPTHAYPTGSTVAKHPQFQTLSYTFSSTDFPTIDKESPEQNISSFVASKHNKLKPLKSISGLGSFKSEPFNNILSFMIEVRLDVDQSNRLTKCWCRVRNFYSQVSVLKVNVLLFGKKMEKIVEEQVPAFFSTDFTFTPRLWIGHQLLSPNPLTVKIFRQINMAKVVQDEEFAFKLGYQFAIFLTGADFNFNPICWQGGINLFINQTVLNTPLLQLGIEPYGIQQQPSPAPSCSGFSIYSFTLSMLFYDTTTASQKYILIQSTVNNTQLSPHPFSLTSPLSNVNFANTEYFFGLKYYIAAETQLEISFDSSVAVDSTPSQLNINIANSANNSLFQKLEMFVVVFAKIQCKVGELINNAGTACILSTPPQGCSVHYYPYPDLMFDSQQRCSPCKSPCYPDTQVSDNSSLSLVSCIGQQSTPNPLTCTECPAGQFTTLDPSTGIFTCQTCAFYPSQCQQWTCQQCLRCRAGLELTDDKQGCQPIMPICNDSKWMFTLSQGHSQQECDNNLVNDFYLGCTNECKIVEGFTCQPYTYEYIYEPSVCLYTKGHSLSYSHLVKPQFSNRLYLTFHLTPNYWNDTIQLNKTVFVTSPQLDFLNKLTSVDMTYDPDSQILLFTVVYDQVWVENHTIVVQVNYGKSGVEVLKKQPTLNASVNIVLGEIQDAFMMINHDDTVYKKAVVLCGLYKLAAVIGLVLMLAGIVGGKFIALQIIAILQITFLGLLQIDRYTPLYLAINRLNIISGNFLNQKSSSEYLRQLNTLGLEPDFYQNFNIQIALFLVFILIGLTLRLIVKILKPQKSLIMYIVGTDLLSQYGLYGLLVFSYPTSVALGLQVRFEFVEKIQENVNYPSLVLGICYVVLLIVYLVLYIKKFRFFGQFYKEMEKFSINEKFICILIIEKIVIGFLLGLFSTFKFIGFGLACLLTLLILYVLIKQPFYYTFNNQRFIINYMFMVFVLVIYNIQKLKFEDYSFIDTNSLIYGWPLVLILVIYMLLVKNTCSLVRQIRECIERMQTIKKIYEDYKEYCMRNQKNMGQDIEEALDVIYAFNAPEKVVYTEKQAKMWDKLLNIDKDPQGKNSSRRQNGENKLDDQERLGSVHQDQDLLLSNFRAKMELQRLDRIIRKKQKSKQEKQGSPQGNVFANQEVIQEDHQQADNSEDQALIKRMQLSMDKTQRNQMFDNIQVVNRYEGQVSKNQNKQLESEEHQPVDEIYGGIRNEKDGKGRKEPLTKKQYDEKVKGMSFIDHWNQIDEVGKKYDQEKQDKQFETEGTQQQQNPFMNYHKLQIQRQISQQKGTYRQQTSIGKQYTAQQIQKVQEQIRKLEQAKQKGAKQKKQTLIYRGGQRYKHMQKRL